MISAQGDRLAVEAPAGALTPDLEQALALHEPALLGVAPWPDGMGLEKLRIPLDETDAWLAEHKLRLVSAPNRDGMGLLHRMQYLVEDE